MDGHFYSFGKKEAHGHRGTRRWANKGSDKMARRPVAVTKCRAAVALGLVVPLLYLQLTNWHLGLNLRIHR